MLNIAQSLESPLPVTSLSFTEKIAEAKRRLPLPLLMEKRGLGAHAKLSAFCPLHENKRTKAFSVFQNERGLWRWKCHSQCGGGDEIAFLEKRYGLTRGEAARQYLAAAGLDLPPSPSPNSGPRSQRLAHVSQNPLRPAPERSRPVFPPLKRGGESELARLSELRSVSRAALFMADDVGLLRFADLRGHEAWIITDDERVNAQARRLDGQPWEHIGAKAWTLPASWASHPIGRGLALHYPTMLIVEGGPDLLAALHFIHDAGMHCDCCPLAMLGASQRIPAPVLPMFAGRHVRIFPHTDPPGREAARAWARQVIGAGAARTDAFKFDGLRRADGQPVKDLNDCTTIHPDDASKLEGLFQ